MHCYETDCMVPSVTSNKVIIFVPCFMCRVGEYEVIEGLDLVVQVCSVETSFSAKY